MHEVTVINYQIQAKKLPASGAKNGSVAVTKKKDESSDSSDSEEDSDEDVSTSTPYYFCCVQTQDELHYLIVTKILQAE